MKLIDERLKLIIAWVGLGASLVIYANSNFTTKEDISRLEERVNKQDDKISGLATKDDVRRVGDKVDKLTEYLLNNK